MSTILKCFMYQKGPVNHQEHLTFDQVILNQIPNQSTDPGFIERYPFFIPCSQPVCTALYWEGIPKQSALKSLATNITEIKTPFKCIHSFETIDPEIFVRLLDAVYIWCIENKKPIIYALTRHTVKNYVYARVSNDYHPGLMCAGDTTAYEHICRHENLKVVEEWKQMKSDD